MLVSELCENGDLFDYIVRSPYYSCFDADGIAECRLPNPQATCKLPVLPLTISVRTDGQLGLMLDIAKGLEYLHTHTPPIIHRDVSYPIREAKADR